MGKRRRAYRSCHRHTDTELRPCQREGGEGGGERERDEFAGFNRLCEPIKVLGVYLEQCVSRTLFGCQNHVWTR